MQLREKSWRINNAHVGLVVNTGIQQVKGEQTLHRDQQLLGLPWLLHVIIHLPFIDGIDGVGMRSLPCEKDLSRLAESAILVTFPNSSVPVSPGIT